MRVQPNTGGAAVPAPVTVTPVTATGVVDAPRVKSVVQQDGQWCVEDARATPLEFGCFATSADADARLRILGASEAGLFRLTATFPVSAPGSDGKADTVANWIEVDSPVDVTQIDWVQRPVLCYEAAGACDANKAILSPPVDIDIYPARQARRPVSPWTSSVGRDVTPEVSIDVGSGDGTGQFFLTVKQPDGYVYKVPIDVAAGGSAHTLVTGEDGVPALADLTLANGEDYWFDLSVRNPQLADRLSNGAVTLRWTEDDEDEALSVPVTLNKTGQQGIFPLAYRGWAYAGYRAESPRDEQVIHEDDFRIGPATGGTYDDNEEACAAQPGGCRTSTDGMGFDADYPVDENGRAQVDLSSATDQIPKTFAFAPVIDETLQASWQLVDDEPRLMGTATRTRSGRLADVPGDARLRPGRHGTGALGSSGARVHLHGRHRPRAGDVRLRLDEQRHRLHGHERRRLPGHRQAQAT